MLTTGGLIFRPRSCETTEEMLTGKRREFISWACAFYFLQKIFYKNEVIF